MAGVLLAFETCNFAPEKHFYVQILFREDDPIATQRNHPCRRKRHEAAPDDPGDQQAAATGLRQADDLLPAEQWLEQAGIGVDCLDDPRCRELMERMQQEKPELWREDIGLPPESPSPGM